ncbi:MAG: GAF domain-containing protein [Candidatus Rokubacteria bacterium]|nr:GAF domain-containing protein [Candidatus Rokubacteria bacterium]
MKDGSLFPELLATFIAAPSLEAGITRVLGRLVTLSGALAGGVVFSPADGPRCTVTAGRRASPALDAWLRDRLARRVGRLAIARELPSGWRGRERPLLLEAPLGGRRRRVGQLALIGRGGARGLRRDGLPPGFFEKLGSALELIWRHQREALNTVANQQHEMLKVLGDKAAIAVQNERLLEQSMRRARETQALLEAGRAVSRSLEVKETIRVILEQAREVLGAASCSLMTLDPETEELRSGASLDLPDEIVQRIRLKVGEGITGLAVKERGPVQSEDLWNDPRVRYPDLPRAHGLRSMLTVPLLVGGRATGALSVLRRDVHRFTGDEERLLSAFADQAAIALEHARLYSSIKTYSEQLESMVAKRTRELNEQKRFVEVVLEALPLGLYVLDDRLSVVTVNPVGTGVLPCEPTRGRAFLSLMPEDQRPEFQAFLEGVLKFKKVSQEEVELRGDGQDKTLRLTAAPLGGRGATATHIVLIVEDITLQKRLARQMLLNERLTTAGRLAAGVAHELNNPLATIAGCAEALKERARAPELAGLAAFQDFPSYLALVEEEAYRCKEITGSLLQLVREPGSGRASTNLNAVASKALELLGHQPRFSGARFVTELDPDLPPVLANEGQLRQVFLTLGANGLEAMEGTGVLTLRTRRLTGGEVEVEFEDRGAGIAPQLLPRIFDPFFTTKPPGQGTGLGLTIAQGLVADHGGRIEVTSQPGQGARFRVVLPLAPEGSQP